MVAYGVAILCVLSLTVGQILFKISATAMAESGSFFAIKPAAIFFAVMCLYGVTAVAWLWVLQKAELGRVYPINGFGVHFSAFRQLLRSRRTFPTTIFRWRSNDLSRHSHCTENLIMNDRRKLIDKPKAGFAIPIGNWEGH